jgi:hypothetical protein
MQQESRLFEFCLKLVSNLDHKVDYFFLLQPTLMDGGNYIKEGQDSAKSTCLIFSPKEEAVGALAKSLKLFEVQFYQTYTF